MNTTGTAGSNSVLTSSENQVQESENLISSEFENNFERTTSGEYLAMSKEAQEARNSGSLLDMQKTFRKFIQHFDPSAEERLGPLEKTTIFYNAAYLYSQMGMIREKYFDLYLDKILEEGLQEWFKKYKISE